MYAPNPSQALTAASLGRDPQLQPSAIVRSALFCHSVIENLGNDEHRSNIMEYLSHIGSPSRCSLVGLIG